jgi:spermidine synthase
MLSPFAIKFALASDNQDKIGTTAGTIFFFSTMGSIFGSLAAGFILIPTLGVDTIFALTGTLLCFLGLIPLFYFKESRNISIGIFIFWIVVILSFFLINPTEPLAQKIYEKDGIYEKLSVKDFILDGRPIRLFEQDKSSSGAMYLDTSDPNDHVFDYTKYYSLFNLFDIEIKNALVIGGGVYTIPKSLLKDRPNAEIHVAEIEPSLYEIAKSHFGLSDTPRLINHIEDGRRFLASSEAKFDYIYSDVYYSLYSIPSHFTTQEFFALAKNKLSSGGIFIANLIGSLKRGDDSLIFSIIKTFKTAFPNSIFFATEDPGSIGLQNIIILGINNDNNFDIKKLTQNNSSLIKINNLQDKIIDLNRFDLNKYQILNDNYSPTEYLTSKLLGIKDSAIPKPDGQEMMSLIEQQLKMDPRHASSEGHKQIQNLNKSELKPTTDTIIDQDFSLKSDKNESFEFKNIIGQINPELEKRIILGAHYDSKSIAEKESGNNSKPVPGANDSASGVSALLEIARMIDQNKTKPSVGIDLVFFDGEEGFPDSINLDEKWEPLGSTYFARNLSKIYPDKLPEGAIILDMICDKDLKIYREKNSIYFAPRLTEDFWKTAKDVSSSVFKDESKWAIKDDHIPLNLSQIPSIVVIDFDFPFHHTTKDTLDKCSGKSLEVVTEAVYKYIYSL